MAELDDQIKQAELDRIKQEVENLRSEKARMDKENEEIERRLNTPFFKSKGFRQLVIATLAIGPLIMFYFNNAIQPVLERNKFEMTVLKDSLTIALAQYRLDTARFSKESRQLSERLDEIDKENKSLVFSLESFKNDYAACLTGNTELEEGIVNQIERVTYTLNFGQLNSYKIGFYYYPEQQDIAESLEKFLVEAGFSGKTELYPREKGFFDKVRPHEGFEIRYEKEFERNSAEKLKDILENYDSDTEFILRPVANRTSGFISVFIP